MADNLPPPCDPELFSAGVLVAAFDARAWDMERFVSLMRQISTARLDWHYYAGRAMLRGIGSPEEFRGIDSFIAANCPGEIAILGYGEQWRSEHN